MSWSRAQAEDRDPEPPSSKKPDNGSLQRGEPGTELRATPAKGKGVFKETRETSLPALQRLKDRGRNCLLDLVAMCLASSGHRGKCAQSLRKRLVKNFI